MGPCVLVINEVQTAGTGGAQDEFIELASSCATPKDLTGYKLAYRSASGSSNIELAAFSSVSVPAHGYLVIGHTSYTGSASVTYSASSLSGTAGGIALIDASSAVVDSVGYGNATNAFVETAAASAPASGQSIARTPSGHDTDDNSADFAVAASPTPGAAN